ncbi:MAG: hypothetical protein GY719_15565, partial [bacterium]|nr:hypothetical protein [bacterium]
SAHLAGLNEITDNQKRQFRELEKRTRSLRAAYEAQRATVDRTGAELREAGIDTNRLTSEQQRLETQLRQTNRQLEAMEEITSAGIGTAFGNVSSELGTLAPQAAMAGAVAAAAIGYTFKTQFVDVAADFEKFRTILETTEGSAEKAQASMDWISDFAAKTPYDLATVTKAFVKLRAYGLNPTNGLLRTLGDTSAAMGKDINAAVEALADAVNGENERLKEFGIVGSVKGDRVLYTYMDREGKQRAVEVEKGNRAAIQSTLESIWNEKFGGAMDKLSNTWGGMISNLGDQWTRFANMVMDSGVFAYMKSRLGEVLGQLNAWAVDGTLKRYAEEVGDRIRWVIGELWDLGRSLAIGAQNLANFVGGWENLGIVLIGLKLAPLAVSVIQLGSAIGTAASGVFQLVSAGGSLSGLLGALGPAWGALSAALAATPIGWVVGGLLAVGAALYAVWRWWDEIVAFGSGFWSGMTAELGPLGETLNTVGAAFGWIAEKVGAVAGWLFDLLGKTDATTQSLDAARSAGESFGSAFGAVLNALFTPMQKVVDLLSWIVEKIGWVIDNAGRLGAVYENVTGKVGGAIGSVVSGVKSFFGVGDDSEASGSAPAPAPVVVPPQAGRAKVDQSFSTTNQITVTGAEDPQATARAVAAELDRREREKAAERRASMVDAVGY